MTKNQEMAVLNNTIKHLGSDSYLGRWLSEVRAEVERDITSDFFPTMTPGEMTKEANKIAAEIVTHANKRSEVILKQANNQANLIIQEAEAKRERVKREITGTLNKLNESAKSWGW